MTKLARAGVLSFFFLTLFAAAFCNGIPGILALTVPVAHAAISGVTLVGTDSAGTGSNTTADNQPTSSIAVGKILFIIATTDNISTTDGCSGNTHTSAVDGAGNLYTKVFECTDTDGVAGDGSTTSVFVTKVTTQVTTSDLLGINLSSAVSDYVLSFVEVTFGTGKTYAIAQTGTGQNALSASVASLTSREYLLLGALGAEGEDTLKDPDADYTEVFDGVSTTAGSATANVQQHVQTRIATLTSDTVTSANVTYTNAFATLSAVYEVDEPTYTQSAYRFFANSNGTNVGSALAAQDTAGALTSDGEAFRLRMLMHVGGTGSIMRSNLAPSFKLQFAEKSGTCDTAYSGESYADVTASTAIAFNNNATPADGDALTSNANDPTHSGDTVVNQDYEEANNFTNSESNVNTGQDGKWDFSLIDNTAPANTSYCFRIVKSDGSAIETPTVVPEIATVTSSNALPTASSVSLDSGATSVTLTENTTKNVSCAGTVTDTNGYTDIAHVGAFFYRTSIGTSSASDNNNLYRLYGDSQCVPSGGSGNSETYTCTFPVQFYADATDAGSAYSSDNWTCELHPADAVATGTPATDTIEMASLLALNVTSPISYGTVNPNTDTGASNQTTTITNTGNVDMDPQLSGTSMTDGGSGSILASQQKYADAAFTYSSGGTALSGTPTAINITLPQQTTDGGGGTITDILLWGLGVPNGTPNGSFTGTNTFTAAAGL